MDLSSVFAAHAPGIEAGAIIALLIALAAALGARSRMVEHAAALAGENEALRDEVWGLKEAGAARDRAEAASEAKSRFLATMSHEIRTPICGVIGMAELLRMRSLNPECASYVEAIHSSGVALIALVDEILDLSKIEAGHVDLAIETFDLRKLVEGVVELLAPRAQSKGLEIAASISAAAPRFVMADAMRLRQVLTNLAGNAVKFTDRGGVCVSVDRGEAGELLFAVTDTGPGVPADRRAAIFEDFEQGDGSNARRFEGAGLGLAISRRLVALMGGALTLADNPGGGSVFAFTAPLAEAEANAPERAADPTPAALQGKRALIIANSPFEAPAIAARLAEAGVRVSRADGLESGLEALRQPGRPDLVVVDCALGPEATNRLAEAARAAGAPSSLVLFSPFERSAFGDTALQGFDGWLVKPVRTRSLFERLAAEFPSRRPRGEAATVRCADRAAATRPSRRGQRHQRPHRREGFAAARLRCRQSPRRRRGPAPRRAGGGTGTRPVRPHSDGSQDAGSRRRRGDAPPASARGDVRLQGDADRRGERQRPRDRPPVLPCRWV